jgi:hypothetical protein
MQVTLRQFVKEFRNLCAQNAGQKALQLGKGQCKDLEEYKKITGWIAGVEAAGELADQMLRQLEEQDEKSDLPQMQMPPTETAQ